MEFTTNMVCSCIFGLDSTTTANLQKEFTEMRKLTDTFRIQEIIHGVLRNVCPFILQYFQLREYPISVQNTCTKILREIEKLRERGTNQRNGVIHLMLDVRDHELINLKQKAGKGKC